MNMHVRTTYVGLNIEIHSNQILPVAGCLKNLITKCLNFLETARHCRIQSQAFRANNQTTASGNKHS